MRAFRFLLVPALGFAVSSVQAQEGPPKAVDSPYNVLQNGGFETKDPDDRIIPRWNTEVRGWSSSYPVSSSQGVSQFAPREGAGAAYMNVNVGPAASVLYQEFTIAPIPVRDCSAFLGYIGACVAVEFHLATHDHSDLFFSDPSLPDSPSDLRRNMTSLENYPGYAGNGPPPDYRDFPTEPPCIPTGYYDEFGNPLCEIGPYSEFWYGAPNENTRQFVTVDLLRGGADPFSMDPDDVVMTFFRGALYGGFDFNMNTGVLRTLEPMLRDGGTFMFRVGVAANLYTLDVMIDEVGVAVYNEPLAAPEPGSLGLMALGLGAFGLVRRRRRS